MLCDEVGDEVERDAVMRWVVRWRGMLCDEVGDEVERDAV